MAKLPWLKLYTEIMDDPKLATWSGDQFRVFIMLLCLAREAEEPGFIPMTPAEISWRIRRPLEEVESTIALCQQGDRPIITAVEGGYQVEKFLDRQYDKPSDKPEATRARKQKQRDKENESRECHANVTPCHAIDKIREDKIRVDKDQDKEKTALDSAVDDFKKFRTKIRASMTDRAVKLLHTELEKLAPGDDDTKIAILNQSILNGWKGVFALKGDDNKAKPRAPDPVTDKKKALIRSLYQ